MKQVKMQKFKSPSLGKPNMKPSKFLGQPKQGSKFVKAKLGKGY